MQQTMKQISRLMMFLAAIMIIASIFVPLWRIELDAPQYPEGLVLQIFSNKLGGQVDIINGLNHYIGMGTLHADNFIEFTILPYILGIFGLFIAFLAVTGKRKAVFIAFISFAIFGIIAMADFWRWEYNYGHNLDPNAAIIVPGMAYQPPLIGFKQLLNFGAYSIPDQGGWMLLGAAVCLMIAAFIEFRFNRITKSTRFAGIAILSIFLSLMFASCQTAQPVPIKINSDQCANCRMTISDIRFATEIVTSKGRVYPFDDLKCMLNYHKKNQSTTKLSLYISDFDGKSGLFPAAQAFYVHHESVSSPMGGNTAAFISKEAASKFAANKKTEVNSWEQLIK